MKSPSAGPASYSTTSKPPSPAGKDWATLHITDNGIDHTINLARIRAKGLT